MMHTMHMMVIVSRMCLLPRYVEIGEKTAMVATLS